MTTLLKTVAAIAGLGALALLAATFRTDVSPAAPPAAPASADQGMTVVRDAETGALRAPTADEADRYALRDTVPADTSRIVRRADGSITAKLDASHVTYATVTRRADGTWERHCAMDHDHALHASAAEAVR